LLRHPFARKGPAGKALRSAGHFQPAGVRHGQGLGQRCFERSLVHSAIERGAGREPFGQVALAGLKRRGARCPGFEQGHRQAFAERGQDDEARLGQFARLVRTEARPDEAQRWRGIAKQGFERGDIAARREASSRAITIISELQSTLNMEQGGELAQRLDELYAYVNARIIAAAAENHVGPIDDATRVLNVLRDSWVAIATPAAEAPVRGAA